MTRLADLGPRICIFGPSNSGKSTLAAAVAAKLGLHPVHLDLLYHWPDTDWEARPFEEFAALHDEAILGERWAIDGNYSRLIPKRLARATGAIRIETATPLRLLRYVRRTLLQRDRVGGLKGGKDTLKWLMFRHILVLERRSRARNIAMFEDVALPKIWIRSASELARFYGDEGLPRPRSQAQG